MRLLFLLLCACTLLPPTGIWAGEAVLLFGNGAEPRGLDPQTNSGIPEAKVQSALFEGLVAEHPQDDAQVVPGAAQSWSLSADGLTYTFHLQPQGRWSNGDPVVAEDFVYAYRRMLNPRLGAAYAYMLYPLRGAEGYHRQDDAGFPEARKLRDFAQVGVRAADPRTLVLELSHPVPYFLQLLKHHTWYPVHPPTLEKAAAFDSPSTGWATAGSLIGNGPFQLEAWSPNRVLRVRRNPHYWDAAAVGLDGIDFFPYASADAENRAFHAGQLHVTDSVPFAQRAEYLRRGDSRFRRDPAFATAYLLFNTRQPPLNSPALRRALALAVDRDTIVDQLARAGQPAGSFVPPLSGWEQPEGVSYDPEAARSLLRELGPGGGSALRAMDFKITTADTTRITAEAVQEMWRRELGLTVRIVNMEWKVYMAALSAGDYDIGFLSWWGDYLDPRTFLDVFLSHSGNNRAGWSDPEYDALVEGSDALADPVVRLAQLRQAELRLLEAMPVAPVSHATHNYLISSAVEGWSVHRLDMRAWKFLRLRAAP